MTRPSSPATVLTAVTGLAIAMSLAACAATPPPTVPPTTGPTPVADPSTPAATPSGIPSDLHVTLANATGNDVTVDIEDASGTVTGAETGMPGDGASIEPYTVDVTNVDPSTLRLAWVGGPCDTAGSLAIDAGRQRFLLVQPECGGDAVAFDRVLILRFSEPIDHADVVALLQDGTDTQGS